MIKAQNLKIVPLGTMDATHAWLEMDKLAAARKCSALPKVRLTARRRSRTRLSQIINSSKTVHLGMTVATHVLSKMTR